MGGQLHMDSSVNGYYVNDYRLSVVCAIHSAAGDFYL